VRFIAAIVTFVIAFGLIAYGIAQRTIFAQPDSLTAAASIDSGATVTLLDSATLQSLPGRQQIDITGSSKVFAAYGRTEDVRAWVGNATYNRLSYSATTHKLVNTVRHGQTTKVPDPTGSDLWLDQYSQISNLSFTVNVPNDITVVILSDGTKPAPSNVSVRWPLDNRTPWAGPLIVGGILLLLVGFGLYLLALRHLRRSRGPRRKTPKMPRVPRQRSYRQRRPKSSTAGRRSTRRRMVAVVPVFTISLLLLSGCSSDLWPEFLGGSPAVSPAPVASKVITPATGDLKPPAVTATQLKAIVARISAVATKADTDKDTALIATRFEGSALALRLGNYGIRKADNTQPALPAIPAGAVELTLPQQTATWPRTVFTVVQNPSDATVAPIAMMLVQATARDNYKVDYAVALEAKTVLPKVARANIGTPRLPSDNPFGLLPPANVASAYSDVIDKGATSTFAKDFDLATDNLIGVIGSDARKKAIAALPATASMSYVNSEPPNSAIALATIDSGAIVSVTVNETVTVTPTEAGSSVNPEGAVKSLSGITGSTKGTVAVYGDQLLFYVPKASRDGSSSAKITLLGFASGLISAKELP
jgi:hypothetical protein